MRTRRLLLVFVVAAASLVGCSDGDDTGEGPPVVRELPDPCRLVTSSTLRRETDIQYRVVDADETENPDARSCSWLEVVEVDEGDGTGDPRNYLDETAPRFLDLAIVRTSDEVDVAVVIADVRSGDDEVVERPEFTVTAGESSQLADEAFSVGGTLYARKGERLLMAATASEDDLADLAEGVLPRLIGRL
jgi:hypothetical protein